MKKIWFFITLSLIFSVSFVKAAYIDEYPEAYKWAFKNWITTQPTIEKANMYWSITRIELSKMISNYAINVLNKKVDTSKKCQFSDVSDKLNSQYDLWVTKACQLWLMWQWISKFKPNDNVTRAEFWTILSRLLYWTKYNGWTPYYQKHVNQLNIRWIMTNINNLEKVNESRGNVMVMLKRSEEKWNIQIPSFEELNDVLNIKCEYESPFDWWDKTLVNLTKKFFILPYKDWYFSFSFWWQDGLSLRVGYSLNKNPCTTYLNSDEILLWPAEWQNMNKIYEDYDNNIVAKELNCKIWDYEWCYKEAEKYAYNLLIWKETNEYFSLRMEVLKKMVDNNEFDSESKEWYSIDWSQKKFDCYLFYKNKIDNIDNIDKYCKYEIMWVCPGKDFCSKIRPDINENFNNDNRIYWKKEWGYDIIYDKIFR
jgi:hypothetical protein